MFEKEFQRQVYAFLTEHELLHPCQHGFRARRSTYTALLTVVDKWLQGSCFFRSAQTIRYSEIPATLEKSFHLRNLRH